VELYPHAFSFFHGVLGNGFILQFLKTHSGGRALPLPGIMIRCIIQPLVPATVVTDLLFAKLHCDESLLSIRDFLSAPVQCDRYFWNYTFDTNHKLFPITVYKEWIK